MLRQDRHVFAVRFPVLRYRMLPPCLVYRECCTDVDCAATRRLSQRRALRQEWCIVSRSGADAPAGSCCGLVLKEPESVTRGTDESGTEQGFVNNMDEWMQVRAAIGQACLERCPVLMLALSIALSLCSLSLFLYLSLPLPSPLSPQASTVIVTKAGPGTIGT
eukprot:2291657-Rhodomonas_salina.3